MVRIWILEIIPVLEIIPDFLDVLHVPHEGGAQACVLEGGGCNSKNV